MKPPRRAASMAYSGQCRRQMLSRASAADRMRSAPPSGLGRKRCGLQHLQIEPERLAYRPGLERTAARGVWRSGVGDFGDVSHSRLFEMVQQRCEEASPGLIL